jgi:hypothetical protein
MTQSTMTAQAAAVDPAAALADDPRSLFVNAESMFGVAYPDIQRLQLTALQRRFDELVDRLPLLRRRAAQAGVGSIETLDDAALLLYPSTIYKSYRRDSLDNGNFAGLTEWLQRLTSHDLSAVSMAGVGTLDGWLARLETATPLRVCHSSATSGKLSFVPRSLPEWERRARTMSYVNEAVGDDAGPRTVDLTGMPIISTFYRSGHSAFLMSFDWNVRVHGDPNRVASVYPGHLSSDLLVLAGRLRAAAGDQALPSDPEVLGVSVYLREHWDELLQLSSAPAKQLLAEYVKDLAARFGGQRVFIIGVWPTLVDAAAAASRLDITECFSPDSIVHTGGGNKGRSLSTTADRMVLDWLGVRAVTDAYGMSEIMGMNGLCRFGNYHINAWTIPFAFDEGGQPMPRSGTRQGRFGAIDLMAGTYWGGFQSSDIVNLTYDPGCACGRSGPYLDQVINRLADSADEKISCAATPALHDDLIRVVRDWELHRPTSVGSA